MKSMIAIAALVASAQAAAFWGWDDSDGYTGSNQQGRADTNGDAEIDMQGMFSAGFSARMRTRADFLGQGETEAGQQGDWFGYGNDGSWANYGYDYPYYYGAPYGPPVAPPQE